MSTVCVILDHIFVGPDLVPDPDRMLNCARVPKGASFHRFVYLAAKKNHCPSRTRNMVDQNREKTMTVQVRVSCCHYMKKRLLISSVYSWSRRAWVKVQTEMHATAVSELHDWQRGEGNFFPVPSSVAGRVFVFKSPTIQCTVHITNDFQRNDDECFSVAIIWEHHLFITMDFYSFLPCRICVRCRQVSSGTLTSSTSDPSSNMYSHDESHW